MNVRFSVLDIAQRILGVILPNFQWRKPILGFRSLIIHEVVKENVISEKPLKKSMQFSAHIFFYRTYEDSNRDM
jgi:hypothetical protein